MRLFQIPYLHAQDYLFGLSTGRSRPSGGKRSFPSPTPESGPGFSAPSFLFLDGDAPRFSEVLFLKLHLLETLLAELLPHAEGFAHPQIPLTLDRVWLKADHGMSHIPYFWRFSLGWLEPAVSSRPADIPPSGPGYCLKCLAVLWRSVLEIGGDDPSPPDESVSVPPEPPAGVGVDRVAPSPGTAREKEMLEEAFRLGRSLAQAARQGTSVDASVFLDPLASVKRELWNQIFPRVHPTATPQERSLGFRAALLRIADRWEKEMTGAFPESNRGTEEMPLGTEAAEPQRPDGADGDDELIIETVVMKGPEDTGRPTAVEGNEERTGGEPETVTSPEALDGEGESAPPRYGLSKDIVPTEGAIPPTVVIRPGQDTEGFPPTPQGKEPKETAEASEAPASDFLAETVVLPPGDKGTSRSDSPKPGAATSPPETEAPSPNFLAKTVVLRPGKRSPVPPAESDTEANAGSPPPSKESAPDFMAETVVLRPGEGSPPPPMPSEPETDDAPAEDPEDSAPDALVETVILRPDRSKGKDAT